MFLFLLLFFFSSFFSSPLLLPLHPFHQSLSTSVHDWFGVTGLWSRGPYLLKEKVQFKHFALNHKQTDIIQFRHSRSSIFPADMEIKQEWDLPYCLTFFSIQSLFPSCISFWLTLPLNQIILPYILLLPSFTKYSWALLPSSLGKWPPYFSSSIKFYQVFLSPSSKFYQVFLSPYTCNIFLVLISIPSQSLHFSPYTIILIIYSLTTSLSFLLPPPFHPFPSLFNSLLFFINTSLFLFILWVLLLLNFFATTNSHWSYI